jgi:hypothetical protein
LPAPQSPDGRAFTRGRGARAEDERGGLATTVRCAWNDAYCKWWGEDSREEGAEGVA